MNKSTLLALLVFAALAAAVFVSMNVKPERGVSRLSLEQVDPAKVDRVVINTDSEVTLEKQGETWRIDGKLADGKSIDRIVQSIAAIRSSDLASRNSERYADLEVDDEKGVRVQLFSGGDAVADLVLGSAARAGSYVRSGDEVYAASGVYRASFSRDGASWVERRAFFDDAGEVDRVEVELQGEKKYALVKQDQVWKLEDPSLLEPGYRFDAAAAGRLVRSLVTIRAASILDEEPAGGLGETADRLRFRVAGDSVVRELTLGAAEDGSVVAKSSNREHAMTLPESVVANLRKPLSGLRDLGFVALNPGDASKVVIVEGDRRLELNKGDAGWVLGETTEAPPEDFEFDAGAVAQRLAMVSRLTGLAEAEGGIAIDAASAASRIEVSTQSDGPVVVGFGPESSLDDRQVVASVGNVDDRVYLVPVATRDQLLAGLESFKRVAPPPGMGGMGGLGGLDPAALQNLPPEVRNSLLQKMAEERQREEMMKRVMEAEAAK